MERATSIEQLSSILEAVGQRINENIVNKGKTLLDKETFMSETDNKSVKIADKAKGIYGDESAIYPSYYGKNAIGEVGFHSFLGESEIIKNNFSSNILDAKANEKHIIDLINKDIHCSSVVQAYRFFESDDEVSILKTFNNSEESNFFHEPNVQFKNNVCEIKSEFNYQTTIDVNGYYYTDMLELSEFFQIRDIDISSNDTMLSAENLPIKSVVFDKDCRPSGGNVNNLISDPMVESVAVSSTNNSSNYIVNLQSKAYVSKVRIYNSNLNESSPKFPTNVTVYTKNGENWVLANQRSFSGYAEFFDITVNNMGGEIKISFSNSENLVELRALRVLGTNIKYLVQDEEGKYYSLHNDTYNSETRKYEEVDLNEFSTNNVKLNIKDLITNVTIGEETFRPIDKFTNAKLVLNSNVNAIIRGLKDTRRLVVSSGSFSTKIAKDIVNFNPMFELNDAKIKVVCSNNEGISWYTHNGSGWIELTNDCPLKKYEELSTEELVQFNLFKDEVYDSGIDISSISKLDFNDINNNKTMKFAYVLNKNNFESECSISKLDFVFKAKGTFVQTNSSEVRVELTEDTVVVTPLINLDFVKINVGISDKFATIVEVDVSTNEEVNFEINSLKDRLTLGGE